MKSDSDHAHRLLDTLPSLVWTSGRDARCNFFNKAWLEFTGRELDEELGDGWTESVHRGDLNDRLKTYLTAFRAREPYATEYRLRGSDGSYQWISEEGRPTFDARGEFSGFLGFALDITLNKFSDRELAEEQRCLNLMAGLSPVAIFQADAEGNCKFVNQRWCSLTGLSIEDSVQRGWLDAIHIEDRPRFEEKLAASFVNIEDLNVECRLCNDEGEEAWVYIQACLDLDEEGAVRSCVGTVTDLTKRKHTADTKLMHSKVESLEALAGQISHEFNNLLTPIILNLNIAQNQLDQPGYLHELGPRLAEAEQAALRAQNVTQRLLAFGKGGAPLKRTVRLEDLVEDARRFPLGGAEDILEVDFPPDLWNVSVDPGQFNQVVVALLTNAAEAIGPDGQITVAASNLEKVDEIPGLPPLEGPHVCLQIEDDGSGITPGMMEKIFDPYFSTKPGHSGLGITTALSIIRKHGGQLLLSSRNGIGTLCTIYLASSGEACDPVPEKTKGIADVEIRGRILIMDDEELIRSSVRAILGNLGYEVEIARDGEEALERYSDASESDDPIAVTLMDLSIQSGMDGKEAIAELVALDPEAVAIVCSGHSNDPVMVNFRDYGFKGAIRKPFHPDELNKLLQELIPG